MPSCFHEPVTASTQRRVVQVRCTTREGPDRHFVFFCLRPVVLLAARSAAVDTGSLPRAPLTHVDALYLCSQQRGLVVITTWLRLVFISEAFPEFMVLSPALCSLVPGTKVTLRTEPSYLSPSLLSRLMFSLEWGRILAAAMDRRQKRLVRRGTPHRCISGLLFPYFPFRARWWSILSAASRDNTAQRRTSGCQRSVYEKHIPRRLTVGRILE